MLDLGTSESFTEEATYSLDCAKQMLQKMLNMEEVPEPQMHDDLMVIYTTMFRAIQSYRFKTAADPQAQQLVFKYIKTVEGLMYIKAQTNPKLAMELQTLNFFPSFFEMPAPVAPQTHEEAAIQDMRAVETAEMENVQQDIKAAKDAEQQ